MKLHALINTETQSFLSWSLTDPSVHDAKEFPGLIQSVQCRLGDVCADAGYLSAENAFQVEAHGGTAYINTKRTTRRVVRAKTPFQRMVLRSQDDRHHWKKRYSRRNNVESSFAGLKQRIGGTLAAVRRQAIHIEATLRLIAWNLTRVHHAGF